MNGWFFDLDIRAFAVGSNRKRVTRSGGDLHGQAFVENSGETWRLLETADEASYVGVWSSIVRMQFR